MRETKRPSPSDFKSPYLSNNLNVSKIHRATAAEIKPRSYHIQVISCRTISFVVRIQTDLDDNTSGLIFLLPVDIVAPTTLLSTLPTAGTKSFSMAVYDQVGEKVSNPLFTLRSRASRSNIPQRRFLGPVTST
jgi:hypothetical protein